MKKRRWRPAFLIDIALPRDVEEAVGQLDNVYLYNIDDLQQVASATDSNRRDAVDHQPEDAELRMLPNQEMELSVEDTLQVMRTIDSLEELDDVQNVFSNLKISDEAMAALDAE